MRGGDDVSSGRGKNLSLDEVESTVQGDSTYLIYVFRIV